MSTAAGVIDLTGLSSSPPSHPDHGDRKPYADRTAKQPKKSAINKDTNAPPEDGEPSRAVKPITTNTQKQRKRKNSQQDSVGTKGENVESNDKRRRREDELDGISQGGAYSPPDVVAGRRSLREKPPGSLFFVDDKPADIRDPYVSASLAGPSNAQQNGGLILPPHVNVADESSETQEPPPVALSDAEEGEEDFIDYLDVYGERSIGVVRYFHDTREIDTKTRFVCNNCGEEGDHKAKNCPHQICLTCGARDEHSTRSCPISKTCFSCGMKGHINKTCPNRYVSRDDLFDDCDRCGSRSHYAKECPTLWRIYDYLSDKERDSALKGKDTKEDLPLGGGEGYIGVENWCFNCGDAGHLGDDCTEIPHQYDIPREPSAFSEYNTRSGPFFDSRVLPSKKSGKSAQGDRNDEDRWGDGHGSSLPVNVGKQGRRKERQRMETLDARVRAEESEDDFLGNIKKRVMPKREHDDRKAQHAGIVIKGAAERFGRDPPRHKPPSLRERLGPSQDRSHIDFPRGRDNGSRDGARHGHWGRNRDRDRDRDRDRGRDRGRDRNWDRHRGGGRARSRDGGHDRGPKYHGGYAR